MKKVVNNYYDVYNFLNIINPRLGKLFKLTRYSPLPEGFVITDANMTELLFLLQLKDENILPPFADKDKKAIKKMFKNGLKHCEYVIKRHPYEKFCSKEFGTRILVYFNIRKDLFNLMLKDFKTNEADEIGCYRECYNLNPLLGKAMDVLFEDKVDFDKLFDGLEENYNLSYEQQIKLLNKKSRKNKQKIVEEIVLNQTQKNIKNSKNKENNRKYVEKIEKNKQKLENNKKIQEIKAEKKKNQTGIKKEK